MARSSSPCLPGPWLPRVPRASAALPAQWPHQPGGQGGQLSLIPQSGFVGCGGAPAGPWAAGWERFPRSRASWRLPFLPVLTEASSGGASVSLLVRSSVWFWWRRTWPRAVSQELRVQLVLLVKDRFFFFFRGLTSTLPTPPPPPPAPMQLGFAKPLPQVVEAKNVLLIFLSLWEVWA